MIIPVKNCPDCGEPTKGRTDKKFCSDMCRNNFNNRLNSDSNSLIRNINNTLRRNRRILLELNPDGQTRVHKQKLVEKGFDFNYLTHTHKTVHGLIQFFCYDHGYTQLDRDFYNLFVEDGREK